MKVTKIDLVMWTKNGAAFLPYVLKLIEVFIPRESVHKRILIDDKSVDETRKIGLDFGWSVYNSEGKGIVDAANTALKYVESEYFASFEQDILLSPDWWPTVPELLIKSKSSVASGIRVPTYPLYLRKFIEHRESKRINNLAEADPFNYGKTLDNTIYETDAIRTIGGFPKIPKEFQCMLDNVLAQRIHNAGYKWIVNYRVKSLHIRHSLKDELDHNFWYGQSEDFVFYYLTRKYPSIPKRQRLLFWSFVFGFKTALETRSPQSIYLGSILQLAELRGLISSRKKTH